MKKAPFPYLALLCCVATIGTAKAQTLENVAGETDTVITTTAVIENDPPEEEKPTRGRFYYKNNVKVGLSPILLGNYSLTYERMLTRGISVSAGYRFMPKTAINSTPLTKEVMKAITEDGDEISQQLGDANMSGSAITAEFRFYTGPRKPGATGFYGGVYGRYSNLKFDFPYEFEATDANVTRTVPFLAETKGFGGGLLFGVQWQIKRVTIDFTILGAHWGKMTGDIDGKTDLSDLSEQDRADLRNDLEDLVNFNEDKKYITAQVNNDGIRGKLDAPFPGIRGLNLSIGFNF
ncbi:hypothetical protein MKQ68_16440 [Chitinophaga horti]|uniref:DUF3575 domain-containing protein n=1 Tax=Chitinophaga horti TaxID=2920382 RepID=A0ABY6J034_9BACT|nr:hypothetical protein [Chitinophaga horti]UYQ91679.1 hypothetical protein MKQ68_16440 [Chitinophaga horti]